MKKFKCECGKEFLVVFDLINPKGVTFLHEGAPVTICLRCGRNLYEEYAEYLEKNPVAFMAVLGIIGELFRGVLLEDEPDELLWYNRRG
ncbi:MAG: hypothetical protein H5U36_05375 [Candidatus Caldatribacterium sp.]|nr:hypothetical protein [Candidatus Caldatribacterium sp.]